MVKITLEFANIESAIIALGKMVPGKVARTANATVAVSAPEGAAAEPQGPVTPPAATAAPRQRKPRADAGKPRGPYRQTSDSQPSTAGLAAAPSQEGAGQGGAANPEQNAAAAQPGDSVAGAPVGEVDVPGASKAAEKAVNSMPTPSDAAAAPSAEDAQKALEALFESAPNPEAGINRAREVLAQFGVNRLRELPAEKRAEFIAATKQKAA